MLKHCRNRKEQDMKQFKRRGKARKKREFRKKQKERRKG